MVLRYNDIHAFDNNKTMKIIYSMYRAGEVSVHKACCERATQSYSLGGGGTVETELKVTQSALDVHMGCTPLVKD